MSTYIYIYILVYDILVCCIIQKLTYCYVMLQELHAHDGGASGRGDGLREPDRERGATQYDIM